MEERLRGIETKLTELQTLANTPKKVVIGSNIPISLFINGPAGEDALYLPKGKVSQIALTLIGPKDAVLFLNVVQAGSNVTEEIVVRLGQVVLTREIDIADWSTIRVRMGTDDLTARLIIGFNFQPNHSCVVAKGIDV